MKLTLDIKNISGVVKPEIGNVILFDGNKWYVTTKEDIIKETLELLENSKKELERLKKENESFKKDVASQLLEMSELIKTLYSK